MSRLDWFTILIVSICVIALGFLIYKTVQLMGNDQSDLPRTEITQDEDRNEHQSAYEAGEASGSDNTPAPGADGEDLDDDELPYDPQEVEAPSEAEISTPTPERSTATATQPVKREDSGSQTQSKPVAEATNTTPKGGTPTSYNSDGEFMVVAGSFSQRYNAESQVKLLKELGYKNARVEIFNSGSLATALVDRFDDYDRAKRLANELKGKGVDSFVKKKQ